MNEQAKYIVDNPRILRSGDRVSYTIRDNQNGFYSKVLMPGVVYHGEIVEIDEYSTKVISTSEQGYEAWFELWKFRRMIFERVIEIVDCNLIPRITNFI
jgi:hypothetical protein